MDIPLKSKSHFCPLFIVCHQVSARKGSSKLQVVKNCIRFCLQLEKRTQIEAAEFREINWLNINDRFSQCVWASIYKSINKIL